MSDAEYTNEDAAAFADEAPDYDSPEAVAARREASGIVFVSHDFLAEPDAVKEGSENRKDVYVGREGEEKSLRAELTGVDGEVNQQVQVDQHPDGTEAGGF